MSLLKKAALATGLFEEDSNEDAQETNGEAPVVVSKAQVGAVVATIASPPSLNHELYDTIRAKVMSKPTALVQFLANMAALESVIPDKVVRTNAALATSKVSLEEVSKAVEEHVAILHGEINTAKQVVTSEQARLIEPLNEQIVALQKQGSELVEQINKLAAEREAVERELASAKEELGQTAEKATRVLTEIDLVQTTIEAELNSIA